MDDIKILEAQLEGLRVKDKDLRTKEALFLKAQGLDGVIEKTKVDRSAMIKKLDVVKASIKKLKDKKQKAVQSVSSMICDKLNEFLPIGEAFFDINDDVSFGWVYSDTKQPYNSLSGAQKQIFDGALENLLGSNIITIEAAELDRDHLMGLIEKSAGTDKQVFINSWFDDFPEFPGVEIVKV